MAIIVEWDTPCRTAIRFTLEGNWDWTEAQAAFVKSDHLLDSAGHPVDFIYDVRRSFDALPPDALPAIHAILTRMHPRTARHVVVTSNPRSGLIATLRQMLTTLKRVYGITYSPLFAADLDQARAMLNDGERGTATASTGP